MKGWLDNFGKAANANNSDVSLPEGFVGMGYNTKGRNYSPAWGGQFQRGGNLVPVSPMQQVEQVVQPTPTVPYLQTKDPAEFYKSWIQNPEYERRLKATGYSDIPNKQRVDELSQIEQVKKERLGLLENIQPLEYDPSKRSEAIIDYYDGSTINVNPSDYKTFSKQSVEAHEIAHVATPTSTMSNDEFGIFMGSMLPLKKPIVSGVQGSKEREASKEAVGDFEHLGKPWEAKADLDALRFMMYDKGIYDITKGKKFTESDFEKAKQSFGKERVFKRFTDRMGKENFVKLMNTIAKADGDEQLPMAMGGMSIPGSVGFTYARTAGSAPSKGKYAKKTMASAQIGKNIEKDETNIDTNIASKIAGLELKQNPEYHYRKYLQNQPQLKQAPGRGEELMRQGLGYADVVTDVMQMGNFIPLPQTQTIGKVGNIAGSIVDLTQAAMAAYNKDYQSALINAASAGLPFVIKNPNILGGYNRSAKYAFGNRSSYLPVDKLYGRMTAKQLLGNRALLGTLGAETAYDAGAIGPVKKEYGGEIPSAQSGITSPLLMMGKILSYIMPDEEASKSIAIEKKAPTKGLTNELLKRQAYKESTFNPAAVSPAGYKGLTQIGDSILKDYSNKKSGKKLNPLNPEDAVELQKFAMDDLYNANFINKPDQSDSVRIAKTLAAYNWGRGNLSNYLDEQKNKGVDIYGSYDWLNNLPKETSDYVNKILLQEDPSFNKNYKNASSNPKYKDVTSLYDEKEFGGDIPSAQNGQEMKFYQNGLDWKPKSMRDGGITKDNQGYWNPDNWGKPVEIDSNDITMEGVYEPLLGVSDTGDTKLMKPGKNYKFKGKKVTEFPVAQGGANEIPREQYLSKFKTYDNVLKSMNYTTPYYKDNNIDTSEGGMNCINGVCSIISNISGVKFDKAQTKDTYTGNATFADNAMDEGYYRSNPEKEGFGTGDIFQYSRKKGSMGSRFPGEVNFKNENDLYPNHAVLIVNEFEKDGQKYFKIANNSGNDKVTLEDISESELMDRYKKGYKTYDGGITYRYDPDKVTAIKKENQEKVNVLKGSNPYAGQYSKYDSSNLSFYNNQVDNLKMTDQLGIDKNLQRYADVYSTVYKDLGKGSNMPVDSFNKLILNQIGIAGQETKFGELANNSKDLIPDSLLPIARRSREIYNYNFGTSDNWKKDYWEKNAENVQKEFSSYEDFVKSFKSEDSDYNPYRTPRSIGEFQQKDLSERGNFYNYDLDSFEGQVKSSLALAVDNYHKLKAKYPDLSEEQIIDLTTLMHNAPGKALEPRFVNYYLKNNDVDYIDKVKSFTPKTIGKKSSTTKKNEEIKFEQISPEKAKSMVDYVNSLQQKKRNGGMVGINQLDAQPMKKLNQLLNFTNNPDKDNWLDKYN
jgi:hypothetical protein